MWNCFDRRRPAARSASAAGLALAALCLAASGDAARPAVVEGSASPADAMAGAGVVAAATYVFARMNMGTALTNKDVAGEYELAVAALNAQALCSGIATIFSRAYAFFMCHSKPLLLNRQYR